jgi:hypothetical protein
LLLLIFFLVFPSFLVFLASNGNTAAFALGDPGTWSQGGWFRYLQLIGIILVLLFLVLLPEYAHRALPWSYTSELTKSHVTHLLATSAALLTGLFVFMFHFHRGPLAQVRPGPLAVGILFAVALLIPIYRSAAKACWKWGVFHLIDLRRWQADWQKVLKEVRARLVKFGAELDASLDSGRDTADNSQPINHAAIVSIPARATPGHPPDGRDLDAGQDQGQGERRGSCDEDRAATL